MTWRKWRFVVKIILASILKVLLHLFRPAEMFCCASTRTHSCTCARASDKEGWREQKKETAREFSPDIWVRLTERTALQAGPSPSAPKMTHDCFDFCHPLSPYGPKTKPPTNTEASGAARTQRHTVTHCILLRLHYLYPRDMSPPCWMTFGLVQQ